MKKNHSHSISAQLRSSLLATILLSLLITGGMLGYFSFRTQLNQQYRIQSANSETTAGQITGYIDDLQHHLNYIARIPALTTFDTTIQEKLLEGLVNSNQAYQMVGLVDENGRLLTGLSLSNEIIPIDWNETVVFQRAFLEKEDFIGVVELDPQQQWPTLMMAVPVRDDQNRVDGMLFAKINLKFLWVILAEHKLGNNGYVYVLDQRNFVIAQSGGMPDPFSFKDLSQRPASTLFSSTSDDVPRTYKGLYDVPVLGSAARISPANWRVVMESPLTEVYAPAFNYLAIIGLGLVISILTALFFGESISRRITSPLAHLTETAERFSRGEFDARVSLSEKNELKTLGDTFNHMAGQLQEVILDLQNQISERKQAEEKLRESEERFRLGFENANIGTCLVDPQGKLLRVNRQMCDIFGYSRTELEGMNVNDITHPDYLDVSPKFIQQATAGEVDHSEFEKVYIHKQGQLVWAQVSSTLIRNETGEPSYFISHVMDITERKASENALRSSETQLEEAQRIAHIGSWTWIAETDTPVWSRELCAILEVDPNQPVPNVAEQAALYTSDSMQRMRAAIEMAMQNGTPYEIELERVRKDGSRRWLLAQGEQWINEQGKVIGLRGTALDITERKQAEEILRENERFIRSTLNGLPFHIAVLDETGTIIAVNRPWLDFAEANGGDPTKTATGMNYLAICDQAIGPDSEYAAKMAAGIRAVMRGELDIFTLDYPCHSPLEQRWYLVRVTPFETGGPMRIVISHSDTSEGKWAEFRIQQQMKRLLALREIDQAIAGSTNIHLVLEVAVRHLLSELNVDAAVVLLLNPFEKTLNYETGLGLRTTALKHTRLKLGDGFAGKAALTKQTLFIENLQSGKTGFLRSPTFSQEGFVSYFGIPLIAKGEVEGVLEIFHRSQLQPNRDWLDFLEAIAGQIAIAIDNAILYTGLQRSNIELSIAYDATIAGWSHAMDMRDKETEGHTQRVTTLSLKLAERMGILPQELVQMRRGALLHDIGKLGVPDYILLKPGKLTEEEWEIMRGHPTLAYKMLYPVAYIRPAIDIPYCHHEKWDGTGYPRGLQGEQIPFAARIFAIVDVWDALTSDRPYRPAWTREKTLDHIKEQSGKHFDPQVVEAFLTMIATEQID